MRGRMLMLAIVVAAGSSGQALGNPIVLQDASRFAVLGASTVTNTGPTVITSGHVGVSPGTAITGFPPGTVVNGTLHSNTALAQQAQTDAQAAYTFLAGLTPTQDLTGQDLGGMVLTPGVYSFSSSAFLTGTLTLDAQGDPNARFVFQTGSTLITASNSLVNLVNSANPCEVFWQVGSSATLGTETDFTGTIIADQSITMNTGATLEQGRVLALNAAVTLDSNTIGAVCIIPLPSAGLLGLAGLGLVGCVRRRRT